MRDVTHELPAIKITAVQLQCDACGAETHAACSCGAIYKPKVQRAAEAVAAHPEDSNRAIADDIGVDEKTVRQARASTADQSAVDEPHTGKDGRNRKLPSYKPTAASSSSRLNCALTAIPSSCNGPKSMPKPNRKRTAA